MLRRVLPENIELRLAADDKVPRVLADSGAVEQMILNLATNARDAMPDGGQLRIDVDERVLDTAACSGHPWMAPGRYVCITVGDTGVGMDEETQSRIFEPFFTTKPAGVGTGLGLAMVYGLMHQQGGCAHVCSEPGQGTTIRLHFPAADTRVTAAADANGDGTKRRILRGDETILLVEDEASLREMCQQVLEHYGYTVVVAADGMEALRAYREDPGRFDLVISDVVMPNMGGADLARVLASEFGSPRLLLVSGYAAWDAGARRGLDPSIPVLEKPWSLEQFLEHVRHALNASRDDQEAHGSRSAIAETGVDS